VRGHEEPDPAVCLLRGPHLRGGEAENALEGADGVLDVEPGEVGAPELVEGQRAGAGVPQPHGPVRVAAVGQALDGDVDEGAAQDRQVLPAGEPAAVPVDEGMHVMPGLGADGAVERGIRQGERLAGFRVRGQRLLPGPRPAAGGGSGEVRRLQAVHRRPAAGGAPVPAFPGDGIGIEHRPGGEPDQDVDRAAEKPVRERGGAVAGVEDEQWRGLQAVPGGAQAAQYAPHLRDRLRCPGRGHGTRHVGHGSPRGAQVPDGRGELVFPARRGLGRALAAAGAVVDVLPARGAPRVRPGIGGRVDREPEPGPPGARVPHLRGIVRGQPGQRLLQQAVVDHVALRDPRAGLRPVDGLRQFRRQQGEEPLVVDSPGGERVVQRAVAAGELRLQAQLHQRRHGVIGAQDRVGQLEQGVRPRVQAFI